MPASVPTARTSWRFLRRASDSAAAVDTAAELVAKDEEYGAKLDAAGDLFVAGMAQRVLARRIA
ncbi:MAG TPA: hypothetical protein VHC63_11360 [Acidimicrobiales bacterium]|nr:hypothetical protein [Acidimicrobiales bacterium]